MRVAEPAHLEFDAWVHWLADSTRVSRAFWHLVRSGPAARDAVVRGLTSTNTSVRRHCVRALDHLVDQSAYPALIAMLDDEDPAVRLEAVHALSCDRCKSDACRPPTLDVAPKALALLRSDPDAHVRAYAVELVGRFVHTDASAESAIIDAATHDPAPAVRKKASSYAPGGTVHERTRPRSTRRRV